VHPGTALEPTCSALCVGLVGLIGVWLQDKINASTKGIKALSAEVQMRRDSRSINQDLARMLVASYESNQKSIQSVSTSLASSQHELDNLDNTIPKHLETEIGPTGATIKMEYINILQDDIAEWTRMLKAAQVLSMSNHASSI